MLTIAAFSVPILLGWFLA
uniref:Uncharacterized protein n=1 Tax=Anguilla anguilla TaxID=7936 RepID=A0A0E9U6Y6_ANGAN